MSRQARPYLPSNAFFQHQCLVGKEVIADLRKKRIGPAFQDVVRGIHTDNEPSYTVVKDQERTKGGVRERTIRVVNSLGESWSGDAYLFRLAPSIRPKTACRKNEAIERAVADLARNCGATLAIYATRPLQIQGSRALVVYRRPLPALYNRPLPALFPPSHQIKP